MKRLIAFCLCFSFLAGCGGNNIPTPQIIAVSHIIDLPEQESSQQGQSWEEAAQSSSQQSSASSSQTVSSPSGSSSSQASPQTSSSQSVQSSSQSVSPSSSSVSSSKPSSSSQPDYEIVDNEGTGGSSSGGSSSDKPSGGSSSGGSSSDGGSSNKPSSSSVSSSSVSSSSSASSGSSQETSGERLSITVDGKKVTGDALDIVCQVVMNEVGDKWPQAAIQAQAVAVYTNIKRQNNAGTSPAFSAKTPSSALKKIVEPVLGKMVLYNGKPAMTTFFAISAGVTASSQNVWTTSYPYLSSVDSWIEAGYKDFEKTVSMSASTVMKKLESKLNVVLDVNDKANWFKILDYHDGEYVKTVQIGGSSGVKTTGRNLRENILGLRSTAFEIDYDSGSDTFEFTTRGYGHGVGLSQVGAYLYAQDGWDYIEILEHYYPGTEVS